MWYRLIVRWEASIWLGEPLRDVVNCSLPEPLKVRVITNTYPRLQDDRTCLFAITEDIAWWLESVVFIRTLTLDNASTTTKRFRLWYTRSKVTIDFDLAEFIIFSTVNQELHDIYHIILLYFVSVHTLTHTRNCYHIQWLQRWMWHTFLVYLICIKHVFYKTMFSGWII